MSNTTVSLSGQVSDVLSELVPEIRRTAELVQQISAANREQRTGAEQIDGSMRSIDRTLSEAKEITVEAEDAASALLRQTEALEAAIATEHRAIAREDAKARPERTEETADEPRRSPAALAVAA